MAEGKDNSAGQSTWQVPSAWTPVTVESTAAPQLPLNSAPSAPQAAAALLPAESVLQQGASQRSPRDAPLCRRASAPAAAGHATQRSRRQRRPPPPAESQHTKCQAWPQAARQSTSTVTCLVLADIGLCCHLDFLQATQLRLQGLQPLCSLGCIQCELRLALPQQRVVLLQQAAALLCAGILEAHEGVLLAPAQHLQPQLLDLAISCRCSTL